MLPSPYLIPLLWIELVLLHQVLKQLVVATACCHQNTVDGSILHPGGRTESLGGRTEGLGGRTEGLGGRTVGLGGRTEELGGRTEGSGERTEGLGGRTEGLAL